MKFVKVCALLSSLSLSPPAFSEFKVPDYYKTLKHTASARQLVSTYPRPQVVQNLRDFIACCRPGRLVGTESHLKAVDFLENFLKTRGNGKGVEIKRESFVPDLESAQAKLKADLKALETVPADIQKFADSLTNKLESLKPWVKNHPGINLVWEKKGTINPEEVLFFGAHYDSIVFDPETRVIDESAQMPGADNNGSGVVALLSMIEVLKEIDLPRTVRVVFFDYHEVGALGAEAYAKAHKTKLKDLLFINAFMLGNDTKRLDTEKREGNFRAYMHPETPEKFQEQIRDLIERGRQMSAGVNFELMSTDLKASDAQGFWREGLPAVVFTQNREQDFNSERLHTPNDFIETLNFRTFDGTFRYFTGVAISWAYQFSLK